MSLTSRISHPARRFLKERSREVARTKAFGAVRFGRLYRTEPASRNFGYDRGTPVDHRYIREFLAEHRGDVRGRVLEFGDDSYTRRFGAGRVDRADVMNLDPGPGTTHSGDLGREGVLPEGAFDCIVCTEVLMLVFDLRTAVANLHRALAPGGVLLLTVAGITPACTSDNIGEGTDYWRFTSASVKRLACGPFREEDVSVSSYGNVLAATAFLQGYAEEELSPSLLDVRDRNYEVSVGLRALRR